ncbi:MAG: Zn-ribbon domain-containing OB-fold protein [Anaerolineales bacterium]|jgi:uncharacterized OB-fold protein
MTLLERDSHAPRAWEGILPVPSRYTFGLGGERFFRALKNEGTIYGSQCTNCNQTYVPATIFCERCLRETDNWIDVGTKGSLHTYTLLSVDYDGNHLDQPEIVAFVQIGDGGLIHRLGEISPDDINIGMSLEAVLKPKDQREGSILDIEYFRPTE